MEKEPGVLYWCCRDCPGGLLSGSLFMLLYSVMRFLWDGQFDMNRVLVLTGVIAFIFLLRILIYSYGYTKAQIGGAKSQ